LLLPSDLRSIPVGFVLNGEFPSDGLELAIARLIHPARVSEIEASVQQKIPLYVRPGTWRPSYHFDDKDLLDGLKNPKPDLSRLRRSIWIVGSGEDASIPTQNRSMTGYELHAGYIEALDAPNYVRGFPPAVGYMALAITAMVLWILEAKDRSWLDLLWMVIVIVAILIINFLFIVIGGRYSDWTSVSVLTIIGWIFVIIKEKVPWLSNRTN
jgi:hypothetical protein